MTLCAEKNTLSKKKVSLFRITPDLFPLLKNVLQKENKTDPFMRSVAYLAMTGRRGLWLFGNSESAMLVCKHPNLREHTLFFPPIGQNPENLILKALQEKTFSKDKIELARLTQDHKNLIQRFEKKGFSKPQLETTLDWTFPVHVLSAEKIINHTGSKFRTFRNRIHRAFKLPFSSRKIDIRTDKDAIFEIACNWAKARNTNKFSFEDLIGPTKFTAWLMEEGSLKLNGVIIYEQSRGIGFWIWEEDKANNMAYSLVRISIGKRGAAEFAALKMAKILYEQQIDFMCTGGSETKSLDDFKRKFNPVFSIDMETMTLRNPR